MVEIQRRLRRLVRKAYVATIPLTLASLERIMKWVSLRFLLNSLTCLSFIVLNLTLARGENRTPLNFGNWNQDTYEVLFTNPVCPERRFISYRPRNPDHIP